MSYETTIERMIAGCLRQMEAKGQHTQLSDEERRVKAEKWAKEKYERDLMNAQESSSSLTRTIKYEIVMTPSMMAAGEIGIAMVDSFGGQKVAYANFDFTNWKFIQFDDSASYEFTDEDKSKAASIVKPKKNTAKVSKSLHDLIQI